MPKQSVLTKIQWSIWIAIYGGLLTLVLAHFVQPADADTACWMQCVGAAFVALGVVLIFLRSRLKVTP
jgi:hypothetical protein